ncbi:helix-turn-helix domain-containing protein [Caulobacter sp. FWC2]|uniref:helix-turn-helix domain-containing protein n=1 Tax=Caulobacter sp. FWC2 TaxID=69664 RepID=UPI000C1523FA|nr:helix-turn-helix domain-containing protein [Caulobacter sp. FWC2]PIB91277.1 hypothetical protein CSW62_06625 [Caulobacter sp. FWC2]
MIVYLSLWRGKVSLKRSMRDIAHQVSAAYGFTLDELRADTQRREIVHARQEAMASMAQQPGANKSAIGRFFGRTSWTVLHAIRAHKARMGELEAA